MSLGGALQIGRSALLANQAAIEVTGNNLANQATQGYHRQTVNLEPISPQQVQTGIFIGRGVQVQAIVRQVDTALEARIRNSTADQAASSARENLLTQLQSLEGELSGSSLSTQLGSFFDAFSQLANTPQNASTQALVVQQGSALASFITNLRGGMADLRTQTDQNIDQAATTADNLLSQIAALDKQIAQQESGAGGANSLRDQRDGLLGQLAQYVDIAVVEQPSGSADVYVGSTPVVLNGENRGLQVVRQTVNGQLQISLGLKSDGTPLAPQSGQLGALIASRQNDVNKALSDLDQFAGQLIWQVNRIHSQGQGAQGYDATTATNRVLDPTAALNSATAGLSFTPTTGSFQITVTRKSTGQSQTSTINVNLDAGSPASLNDLVTQLNSVANLQATKTTDNRLQISAANGDYRFTFGNDSSGVLAALGINTYFAGTDASNISVNSALSANPALVAAGQGNVTGDNRNALALANLRSQSLSNLNGQSLTQLWNQHVADYAVRLSQAKQQATANTAVVQNLQTQQQAVSGVNTDEETINLLAFQRSYQAAARFLSTVDQMMQTLLQMT